MANFKKYTHVERLGKAETEGLLDQETIYIEPKIDSTNASVYWDSEHSCVRAASRTRELTKEKDNAGFYQWVMGDDPEAVALREFVKDYSYLHVFGEWIPKTKCVGHIKDYDQCAFGKLHIFDMYSTMVEQYLNPTIWRGMIELWDTDNAILPYAVPYKTYCGPITMEQVAEIAKENKYMLTNAGHAGEGVVLKAPGFINKYGNQCYGKFVLDEYLQSKGRKAQRHRDNAATAVDYIVENYCTNAEITKAIEKTCVHFDVDKFVNTDGRFISFLLQTVWKDAVLDECADWTKKMKNPTIDFKALKCACDCKVKRAIGLM